MEEAEQDMEAHPTQWSDKGITSVCYMPEPPKTEPMNAESIQLKIDKFFLEVSPIDFVKRLESLGYEFEDIDPDINKTVQENYWDLL